MAGAHYMWMMKFITVDRTGDWFVKIC